MAYVMALQQRWPTSELKFQVNNDIQGLINSVNDGTTSAFMWEWFTTKPFSDAGECRFIGQVPTPWPSWLIAAHPTRAEPAAVRTFLNNLSRHVRAFASAEARAGPSVKFVMDTFSYPETDVKEWLDAVEYPEDCSTIPWNVITDTLSVLQQAGVVAPPEGAVKRDHFVNLDIVTLV